MNKNLIWILPLLFVTVIVHNQSLAITPANSSNLDQTLINASDFDEAEIYNAFTEIDNLISCITENDSISYSDIQKQDNSLLSQVDNDSESAYHQHEKFTFNKQTAYLSGCIFGAIGIALVAIINNGDQERLKSAIWGCVTSGCVSLSSVLAIYLIFFSYVALSW